MRQIYKVFLNDRLIEIGSLEDFNGNPLINFKKGCNKNDIMDWFNSFAENELKEIYIADENPENFLRLFRSAFINVDAAGGLVISKNQLLVIFRNGRWDLPKGKIEKGEKPSEAALREVGEECGIKGHKIVRSLPSTFHIYRSPYQETRGEWIFKETLWFEMSYDGITNCTPQREEGITDIKWVSEGDIGEILNNTYENIKIIIRVFLKMIRRN